MRMQKKAFAIFLMINSLFYFIYFFKLLFISSNDATSKTKEPFLLTMARALSLLPLLFVWQAQAQQLASHPMRPLGSGAPGLYAQYVW